MNPDPDDVTFQFNQIQLSPDADDDVTFGFNKVSGNDESESLELRPETSTENDDVDHDGENHSVSQQFTPQNDDVDNEDDDVTFGFSQVNANDDSKSVALTPENDDVEDEDDDVTFGTNQVQIDSKPRKITPESSPENDDVEDEDDDVTFGSSQAQINTNEEADVADEGADVEDESDDVDDEEEDELEGEEFTFMCINSDNEITELTEKTVFPLFDQSLLYNNFNQEGKSINDIHVNNVFIESPRRATSSSSTSSSTTTLTAITDSNEMNIKSNSTGFSKLWRFRDNNNINRSNSDGRDAFVFLNPKTEGKIERKTDEKAKGKGVSEGEGKAVVKKKVKKANVSAHEVYLKKAKGGGEEEKRKSYLPYRPGLMGFFTNVNGGLSKNVHPF